MVIGEWKAMDGSLGDSSAVNSDDRNAMQARDRLMKLRGGLYPFARHPL
jgi:hypothetical protein